MKGSKNSAIEKKSSINNNGPKVSLPQSNTSQNQKGKTSKKTTKQPASGSTTSREGK